MGFNNFLPVGRYLPKANEHGYYVWDRIEDAMIGEPMEKHEDAVRACRGMNIKVIRKRHFQVAGLDEDPNGSTTHE
ncbi:hypothetical protein [Actinocrispum wychmicini]|uniref:Uncharacterized protein n=1 Tax=Actinocrispum wychmicini TaxID=1213861 RepID=A0A4R2JFF6_9PSEU|nr:hypothetical protein [Actinocrispum wychmicini]TCO52975.1 hypothetical protein EV192_111169 [Actinocrispum wychmicini]